MTYWQKGVQDVSMQLEEWPLREEPCFRNQAVSLLPCPHTPSPHLPKVTTVFSDWHHHHLLTFLYCCPTEIRVETWLTFSSVWNPIEIKEDILLWFAAFISGRLSHTEYSCGFLVFVAENPLVWLHHNVSVLLMTATIRSHLGIYSRLGLFQLMPPGTLSIVVSLVYISGQCAALPLIDIVILFSKIIGQFT